MAKVKVGINGFGRIGRLVFRQALNNPNYEIVAINDLCDPKTLAHLLKYDSTHKKFNGEVSVDGSNLVVNGKVITIIAQRDPALLPWRELGCDLVVESTGLFTSREAATKHITAGAKKLLFPLRQKTKLMPLLFSVSMVTQSPAKKRSFQTQAARPTALLLWSRFCRTASASKKDS